MFQTLGELLVRAGLMLIASGAIAALAVIAARALGLHRSSTTFEGVDQTIDRLVRTADAARDQGLIRAEAELDARAHPALRLGLRLAIAGRTPAQVRQEVAILLDQNADARIRGEARTSLALASMGVIGLLLLLGWSTLIALTNSASPTLAPSLMTLGALVAIVSIPLLSWAALRADRIPQRTGAEELASVLTLEAVALIAGGAESAPIRERLLALLPPSQRRLSDLPSLRAA